MPKKMIMTKISEAQYRVLEREAASEGISLYKLVYILVSLGFDEYESNKGVREDKG